MGQKEALLEKRESKARVARRCWQDDGNERTLLLLLMFLSLPFLLVAAAATAVNQVIC